MFSDEFWMSLDEIGRVLDEFWTSLDKYGRVWTSLTSLDAFGWVWTSLDKFGRVWTSLDKFGRVWTSLDKVSGEFSRQLGIAEVLANYLKTTLYDKKLTCLNGKRWQQNEVGIWWCRKMDFGTIIVNYFRSKTKIFCEYLTKYLCKYSFTHKFFFSKFFCAENSSALPLVP